MDPKLTHALLKYSSEFERQAGWKSLQTKTTTLKQILKKDLDHGEVARWFLKGFQKSFSGNWSEGRLNLKESDLLEFFLTSKAISIYSLFCLILKNFFLYFLFLYFLALK